MYEELYAHIPEPEAYLERLGIPAPLKPNREFLDRLVYAHQCAVPFENLDICDYHMPVSLAIPALYDKIVLRKRGGYCFELNGLFTQLLKDLGYRAWSCMCRIVRGRDYLPPIMHRGVVAEVEGELYYCDVGFGGPAPSGAVKISEGGTTECRGELFHTVRLDDNWWALDRTTSDGSIEHVFRFYTMPQENVDFIALNNYCSTSPDSNFTKRRSMNLKTPEGNYNLMGSLFTEVKNGKAAARNVGTQTEFLQIAEQYFHLKL